MKQYVLKHPQDLQDIQWLMVQVYLLGDGDAFAGIAWEEKTASDGITEIVAALNGVWDLTDGGGGSAVGELLSLDGTANEVRLAVEADIITGSVVGKALETAGANEVFRVRVGEW